MTESFLLTFLKKVYSKNIDYCVVCLRTSDERRLEKPNYVKKFATSINQLFMLNDPNHMACYICERQAAAALRFRKASSLAAFAISTVATIKRNPKKREMIHTGITDDKNRRWLYSVLSCESEMVEQRSRSQLLMTEVLVITSPNNTQPKSSNLVLMDEDVPTVSVMGQTQIATRGESRDQYVVPDEVPTGRVGESRKLTQKPEEIIICDEDDDPITIKVELENDPIAITNDPITQQKDPIKSKDDPKLVPVLTLIDNQTVGELSMVDTNTIIEAPTEYILHPIIFNSGIMTVPSLSANIVDGKLVTKTKSNLLTTPRLALQAGENLELISDPNKVTNLLRVLSHQDAAKVYIYTTNTTSTNNNVQNAQSSLNGSISTTNMVFINTPAKVGNNHDLLVGNPALNNNGSANKIPTRLKSTDQNPPRQGPALLRTDRIDWEDKIPMDVISFVCKNDTTIKRPRYSDGQTPLGISDVVSLNNEEVIIDLS